MTEKRIFCPACHSENLDNSVYCCQCGSPMRKGIPARIHKSQWLAIIIITLILSVILTSAIQFFNAPRTRQPDAENRSQTARENNTARPLEIDPAGQPDRSRKPSRAGQVVPKAQQETEPDEDLIVGRVSIVSPSGVIVSEFPAPVINGSWLALPSRACIGGDNWFFTVGNEKAIPIEGGLWGRGDAVGLWHLAGEGKFQGPGFSTWNQDMPVRLLSIDTGLLSKPMSLTPSGVQGAFIYISLPGRLDPGVFLQNGMVVGWSFGDILDGAYMWPLGSEANLLYTNYVDDFYNETFAGGREEYFSIALTEGRESSPQGQLQMFAEAFRHSPKLSPEDTPRRLRVENIYPLISKLVNIIMDQSAYHYIATLTGEPLLWEARDPELLMNVVLATRNVYGPVTAVNFMEGPGENIRRSLEGENEKLTRFHLELYLGWIKSLVDSGNISRGWDVYDRARPFFNESPELQLLAVELALAGGDWAVAESLLYQRAYPDQFRETRMMLADRISDLKGQENKIVIKFQPGSRDIPVIATVNDRIEHDFLIDTGASFVTIPYSTVEALGIEDTLSMHQQEVQTAGGTVYANTVTLSSVELHGWIIPDVKALVIDLPNRPGLGLLGLNFLNRFGMDLQADEGIITLEPK
ncbi:MAG: retroviral-like aspartic protease family protein [Desulfobulbaceae bacterium]|nr:retroviral-like aspartic protease family protein [Desulfobulbaceae bacterium]